MNADLPLAEFTALLARQFSESATVAERRQRDDYVALAAEVDGPLESYLDRTLGCTDSERREVAERYLSEVVMPMLSRSRKMAKLDETVLRFDRSGLDRLVEHFGESIREAIEPGAGASTWAIERLRIDHLVREKLRWEAEARYRDIRALLRSGIPHTQIRGGKLSAKVLLQEGRGGSVTARLVSAESARDCSEAISTLTVDFTVGAFPSFD